MVVCNCCSNTKRCNTVVDRCDVWSVSYLCSLFSLFLIEALWKLSDSLSCFSSLLVFCVAWIFLCFSLSYRTTWRLLRGSNLITNNKDILPDILFIFRFSSPSIISKSIFSQPFKTNFLLPILVLSVFACSLVLYF